MSLPDLKQAQQDLKDAIKKSEDLWGSFEAMVETPSSADEMFPKIVKQSNEILTSAYMEYAAALEGMFLMPDERVVQIYEPE